ncbi:MAG: ABC transporter permease [Deltaproteobacteria bacterium]|nr:ABC transporter permease [Deltaproteobacteria bacterium]
MSRLSQTLAISLKDTESYYSKPPLITWALIMPAVLLLAVFVKDPQGYLAVAPGIVAMTLLFGNTSMAAIVITFEKRSGTLNRLLLAPLSHRTIIAGKGLSAGTYGLATALVLLLGLHFLLGLPLARPFFLASGLILGAAIFSLLGLLASVLVNEVFEAMTLMNYVRFPLLFVSGVFMPLEAMPGWLKPVAFVSPLTHIVDLLRHGSSGQGFFVQPLIPLAAAALWLALVWLITVRVFPRRVSA